MHTIIPDRLWTGNAGDLREPGLLERAGVGALVHVAMEEQLPTLSRELLYCHFPLVEGIRARSLLWRWSRPRRSCEVRFRRSCVAARG